MRKKVLLISLFIICIAFISYVYLKNDDIEENVDDVYLETVVFKDSDNELIPISINFYSEVELEADVRNRIDLMKSEDFVSYGLYPVLNDNLEVLSAELDDGILTLNFNDELYTNNDDMRIIEAITYTMTDYENVEQLQIQIEGEDVSYLPNSIIPLSSLTHDLGLNNFEDASPLLNQTVSVMAYQEKIVEQYSYYVPTTIRIDENADILETVQTILSYVNSQVHLLNANLDNGILTIELNSNILLDNERIDQSLENLIVLSLCTLQNVEDVDIMINDEDVRTQQTSQIEYNYIKI